MLWCQVMQHHLSRFSPSLFLIVKHIQVFPLSFSHCQKYPSFPCLSLSMSNTFKLSVSGVQISRLCFHREMLSQQSHRNKVPEGKFSDLSECINRQQVLYTIAYNKIRSSYSARGRPRERWVVSIKTYWTNTDIMQPRWYICSTPPPPTWQQSVDE